MRQVDVDDSWQPLRCRRGKWVNFRTSAGKRRSREYQARAPLERGTATITGVRAAWATAVLTEPRSIPANPPRPWLPTRRIPPPEH